MNNEKINFEEFEKVFDQRIVKRLNNKRIDKPTEIQKEGISTILTGCDVIMQSKTGSGKTLAYILPIIKNIDMDIKTPQAVILAPTHELASQIYTELSNICIELEIETALLIGGANINRQKDKLKEKPKIIVGTAGRILDLFKLKKLKMHTVKTIVIDECDRMLSDINISMVNDVIKTTLRDTRQIVMCSASLDEKILSTAKSMTKENVQIIQVNDNEIPQSIKHYYFVSEKRKKFEMFRKMINAVKPRSVLVFINNEVDAEELVSKFIYHGIKASYISGDDKPQERKAKLDQFRSGKIKLLLTTDLLSRGLDIEDLYYVVNYNLPEDEDIYQHRAGRVGRNEKVGFCISLIDINEYDFIRKFERKLKIKAEKRAVFENKIVKS